LISSILRDSPQALTQLRADLPRAAGLRSVALRPEIPRFSRETGVARPPASPAGAAFRSAGRERIMITAALKKMKLER
jgi:hypothetical protein